MKKPQQQTPAQELQFWTAVIRGARDIERRALVEMQRITDAIEGSSRRHTAADDTVLRQGLTTIIGSILGAGLAHAFVKDFKRPEGAQPKTTTTAAKEKPEWTAERREQQARRMRRYWKKRRAAEKATRRPRAMSAAGTA